jgi:hypothetical protein
MNDARDAIAANEAARREHVQNNPDGMRYMLNTGCEDDDYLGPRCFGTDIRAEPFPKGAAMVWIDSLPRHSIHSWNDMKKAFNHNFKGT